ncbi:hypothetical protein [Gloeocapsopsis dulcis]|uniref:Uncharacterized protein n=1 Tax=Gloeocapsopsis dulcis AAB1 = 1H9 TaxID=1433147 RepID=A0A6N8FTZ8_9CHRO|nr:hypothetical protein [Gloeocapsopsis dulcis]MUL35785.1 hypothetical protein [Gloeocapsopsis dulcis AAB1 = 1H9]WNN90931.1 hypothetical protein P0S91_07610 [Gloeocapsopsis dulcis]
MASIKISELKPAGNELFQDEESFLDELNERETLFITGGKKKGDNLDISVLTVYTESIGISLQTFSVVTQVKKIKIKIKY